MRLGQRREMPADFREVAHTLTITAAQKRYTAGYGALKRWYDEAGLTPAPPAKATGPAVRPIPDWFPAVAREPARKIIADHGVTSDLISRWRRELGIDLKAEVRAAAAAKVEAQKARRGRVAAAMSAAKAHVGRIAPPDTSFAGTAADDLRRAGYSPVCRARTRDPKASADHWIVGRRTLTTDEMMRLAAERAQRRTAA